MLDIIYFCSAVLWEEGIFTIEPVTLYSTHDSLYGDIPTNCNSPNIRGKRVNLKLYILIFINIMQSPSSGLAATICQGLSHLKNILAIINGIKNSSTSSKSLYDTLEDTMKWVWLTYTNMVSLL